MRKAVFALVTAMLTLVLVGCGGATGENLGGAQSSNAGYIPTKISNLKNGGSFPDGEPKQQHDGGSLSLRELEGQWVYEGIQDNADDMTKSESHVVTDKTMMLNDSKVECLPKGIDFRPYSPVKTLFAHNYGYGAAVFADASEPDGTGIVRIETSANMPYGGNGFVCAMDKSTLALGFLGADAKLDDYGRVKDSDALSIDKQEDVALDECDLTEIDYEVTLDGDKLTLGYGGASATYVRVDSEFNMLHGSMNRWFGEPLYEGSNLISIIGHSAKDLLSKGFKVDCDLDELLSTCGISKEITVQTPGGATLLAKLVNPYEKPVPLGYAEVCWYQYDGKKAGSLTVGIPSKSKEFHTSQEFGVTPYADVYNHYELPYESSEDFLCYKTGYISPIRTIKHLGEGYDTGERVLESKHSCDIRLEFEDNVLSSISVGDPVYLNAGLQDNIAHDDLNELKPSVYREVTEQRDKILDELKKSFKTAGLDAAINEKTGEVVMDNNVLFAVDSYELGQEGKDYLNKVFSAYATVILDSKYSAALKEVSFEGNTDSDGDSEYNMRLSDNRANAVMEYCSGLLDDKQKTVFDDLAASKGYGESDLVYDDKGQENKDASRRVAIKFMMKLDDQADDSGSQTAKKDSSSASTSSSSSAPSSSASSSSSTKEGSDELKNFREISKEFDQAWAMYEKSETSDDEHITILLLSKDHRHCAYLDMKQNASSVSGNYTFGETSVEESDNSNQIITVRHDSDEDKLAIIFNAWNREDAVSVSDCWGGVNNLTVVEDVGAAASTFEEVLE